MERALAVRAKYNMKAMERLSNTVYVRKDNAPTEFGRVCLAHLMNSNEEFRSVNHIIDFPARFTNYDKRQKELEAHEIEYMNWVLLFSPWRHAYLTTDWKDIEENGLILSTIYSAQYTVGAMIAIRYLGEFPEMVRSWWLLQQQPGISRKLAFVLCHRLAVDEDWEVSAYKEHYGIGNNNHHLFNSFDKTSFKMFMREQRQTLPSFFDDTDYTDMMATWGEGGYNIGWPANRDTNGEEDIMTTLGFLVTVAREEDIDLIKYVAEEFVAINKELLDAV